MDMKTYFTVYRVTNRANKKFYIGSHRTSKLDDGYMGSGKLLKRAFKKYGMDSFDKEILSVFETSEEMFSEEARLVDKDDPQCYNLKEGGEGGYDHLIEKSESHRQALSKAMKKHWAENKHHCSGRTLPPEHKKRISEGMCRSHAERKLELCS
jgi:group I intron endonuclease